MSLSLRLNTILKYIQPVSVLADIGCDHGKLLLAAMEQSRCQFGVGTDLRPGPLKRAQEALKMAGYEDRTQFFLTDGMKNVPIMAQTWVIAGMGAQLITRIIKDSIIEAQATEQLVLCPHHQPEQLRLKLAKLGFSLKQEELLYEDHYYWVLVYQYTGDITMPSIREQYFGGLNNPIVKDYARHLYQQYFAYQELNPKAKALIDIITKEFSEDLPEV